jgi:Mg2+ and Co2+ transporter CorA
VLDYPSGWDYPLYIMTKTQTTTVRFNKHHVTNGTVKARVHYSLDNRADGRRCVTLYAKDYSDALAEVLSSCYVNDTDFQTDYFDKGRAVLFETHPLYAAARVRAAL